MMKKTIIIMLTIVIAFMSILSLCDVVAFSRLSTENKTSITDNEFLLDSSLFTQKETYDVYNQPIIDFTSFTEKIKNNDLTLYTNEDTGAIRIINETTGFTWCSDVFDESVLGENLAFKNRVKSAFIIVYRDSKSKPKEILASDRQVSLKESIINNKLHYDVTITSANINFSYDLSLNNNKLNVLLDYESINEGENKITSITFYPYLGSVYKNSIPSYLFIPSGNGALVRFDREPSISMQYTIPFYGSDANLGSEEEEVFSLPIYGLVQGVNQNAMMVEIKDGSQFAKFNYKPSSIDQNFNMVYADFKIRETYSMVIPGSDSILMVPSDFYKNNIEIEYTFLDGDEANYVGFAHSYQNDLISRGILKKENSLKNNIDIQIEAFGSDYEKGLLFKKYYDMTTTKDILDINNLLEENNIENIFYTLRAFTKNGYSAQSAKNISFDHSLGRLSDLDELETYLYYNPIENYNNKKTYPSRVLVNVFNEKNYFKINDNKYKFYSGIDFVVNYTSKALDEYENIALDGIGYRLYGDKNNNYTRFEVQKMFTELFSEKKLPFYSPNYYFLQNTSKYLNMPLYHDRLRFVTDSVPFMQILLKGYIDYYSPFLNFSSNPTLDALRCIEYGVYPAYIITKEQSYLLSDTMSSNYYATYFETSKDLIIMQYKSINDVLSKVINATIVDRTILQKGISEIKYSNGITIVVNYTSSTYLYKGMPVSSMGYVVI